MWEGASGKRHGKREGLKSWSVMKSFLREREKTTGTAGAQTHPETTTRIA